MSDHWQVVGAGGHHGPPRRAQDDALRAWCDRMVALGYAHDQLPDLWLAAKCQLRRLAAGAMDDGARWWRVIGVGGHEGPARRSPREAEAAWERRMMARGYQAHELGTAWRAGSCRLVAGTTRRAVEDADVSRLRGSVGNGEWWRSESA